MRGGGKIFAKKEEKGEYPLQIRMRSAEGEKKGAAPRAGKGCDTKRGRGDGLYAGEEEGRTLSGEGGKGSYEAEKEGKGSFG